MSYTHIFHSWNSISNKHIKYTNRKPYKHFTVLTFSLILIFTVIIRYIKYKYDLNRTISLHFFVLADFFVVIIFIIGLTMSNPYRFTYSIKNTILNLINSFLYSFLVVLTEKRGSIVNYSITRFTYYVFICIYIYL